MSIQKSIKKSRLRRQELNAKFARKEVLLSQNAEKEQHFEISGINDGIWQIATPGGGHINNTRSHTSSALGIGQGVHTSKNTGMSSIDAK